MAETLEAEHTSNVVAFPMPQSARRPVSIDVDLNYFANNWLPIAEMAAAILAKDRTELQLAVKELGHNGLRDLIDDLGRFEQRLLSLAELARAQVQSAHS